jgi:hypothetical protein
MPPTRIAFADTNWLFSLYYQTLQRRGASAASGFSVSTPRAVAGPSLTPAACDCSRNQRRRTASGFGELDVASERRIHGGGAGPTGGNRATGDQTNCGMTQENKNMRLCGPDSYPGRCADNHSGKWRSCQGKSLEKSCGLAGGCRMSRWARGGDISRPPRFRGSGTGRGTPENGPKYGLTSTLA